MPHLAALVTLPTDPNLVIMHAADDVAWAPAEPAPKPPDQSSDRPHRCASEKSECERMEFGSG